MRRRYCQHLANPREFQRRDLHSEVPEIVQDHEKLKLSGD
jgi:hypothetical protein